MTNKQVTNGVWTKKQVISQLRDLQRDRPNIGADLTLWRLINLLIAKEKGGKE